MALPNSPGLADLKYLFYGGGSDAEYAFLQEAAAEGVSAADILEVASGNGAFVAAAPGHVAGQYYGPMGASGSTRAFGADELRLVPYLVRSSQTFDRMVIETTTAGGAGLLYRLGIWNHNPLTGRPGTLVLDAGTVVGDAVAGAQEKTISQLLAPDLYWLGAAAQVHSGSPALRAFSGGNPLIASGSNSGVSLNLASYVVTGVSGAFATLVGSAFGTSTVAPVVLLRAA